MRTNPSRMSVVPSARNPSLARRWIKGDYHDGTGNCCLARAITHLRALINLQGMGQATISMAHPLLCLARKSRLFNLKPRDHTLPADFYRAWRSCRAARKPSRNRVVAGMKCDP
jgi:hypothetical protein